MEGELAKEAGLKPPDLLRLWYLLVHGGEARQGEIRPAMEKRHRLAYLELDLIRVKAIRPQILLELTDHAWRFLSERLGDPLETRGHAAGPILGEVLKALDRLMRARGIRLSEVFPLPAPALGEGELWRRFFRAWEGRRLPDGGIRLRDLREELAGVPREALDETLRSWQREGKIVLYSFDDPSRTTPEDEAAALEVGGRNVYTALIK
ncbi:MAG: hypothetical protein LBU64_09475 [Planctomycetota bacterium]|jgi:hypothetical protein|nr:hypothetical protein [Planctomycetota bacterium]